MMTLAKGHKDLLVWKESMSLVKLVHETTKQLPAEEKYGLISQTRRASVSVPSNVAEGAARKTKKDARQFFYYARASLSELDTQVELCKILGLLRVEALSRLDDQIGKVDSLLSGLLRYRKSL
jgi:four helix bundle protein